MKAREAAVKILQQIENNNEYASLALKKSLSYYLNDEKEKSLATELVYGVLRYKMLLDYIRDSYSKIPSNKIDEEVVLILRVSIYQIIFCDKIPDSAACNEGVNLTKVFKKYGATSFVNGLLRTISKNKNLIEYPEEKVKKLGIITSFPKSVLKIFINDYGFDKAKEIAEQSNITKPLSYRINYLKAQKGFEIPENVLAPEQEQLFKDGIITIQDKGSVSVVDALSPEKNDKILDLCAAPGGKTCYISEKMENTGEITACDIYEHRLELIENTAKRLGATNITAVLNDGTLYKEEWNEKFDRVLTDVPCSGLGVISSKPDIKWRKHNFDELYNIQLKILLNGMKYVKSGGIIVYSTCTVHKAENEEIIEKALSVNKEFAVLEKKQLFPCAVNDGFFICKMKKR